MQVQIMFTTYGSNSAFGSFAPGDKLRCSAEMAKHLVEESQCAKYVEAAGEAKAAAPAKPTTKRSGKVK